MLYLALSIAVLVVVALCVAIPMLRRNHRLHDVDRFQVARSITTSWAADPTPHAPVPASGDEPT